MKEFQYLTGFGITKGLSPNTCPHAGQHEPLIGMGPDGTWKTAPAAHYPGPLCAFLATAIYKTWKATSSVSKGVVSAEVVMEGPEIGLASKETEQNGQEQPVHIQSGCQGPPLTATYAGRSEPFCDGMGLCSAGRWHPKLRQKDEVNRAEGLL